MNLCMRSRLFNRQAGALVGLVLSCSSIELSAEGFGIFEPRGLAMGGTTVALSSTDNALFYNPALLSFHEGDEDTSKDGSFYFPVVSVQASQSLEDLLAAENDNLDDDLSSAIDDFNVDPSVVNAQSVVNSSQRLLDVVDDLDSQDVFGDAFIGLSLTEPGEREGAGFYLGGRVVGGGLADITDADQSLLNDYVEALDFIASGGLQGEAHPELFNGTTLINPVNSLTSSARVKGAGIVEFGVSLSKEYDVFGLPVAFGVTPKLMRVHTYEATQTVSGGDIVSSTSEQDFNSGNVDVGIAVELADRYRIGLAVKDIISQDFDTELGNTVSLKAKPRLGVAYITERLALGLDVDLDTVAAIGEEASIQEISVGGEWKATRKLFLRAGYRHDLNAEREDIASVGVGMNFGSFLVDVAYASSNGSQGVAIQFGFRR